MSPGAAGSSAERVLAERIGLDPETVGTKAIARALNARMLVLGLKDRDTYLRRLAQSDDEQQELVEEVVVPESWFFRDEQPFVALRGYLATRHDEGGAGPGVGAAMTGAPLRVLSIPCGCGEEPYSIAITLRDLEFTPGRFQIDAVDVSARHLATAERGIYRANSFRGGSLDFRDRYFQPGPEPESFQLDAAIRATVRFVRGNLLDPKLLTGQAPYDIIFCRNVLIYFDAGARRKALEVLDRLLGAGGLLFVGHADRLAIDDPRFAPYGENASFILRHAGERSGRGSVVELFVPGCTGAPPPHPDPLPGGARATARSPDAAISPGEGAGGGRGEEGGGEARPMLPECSSTLLAEAAGLADRGENEMAAACCERVIGRFGPSAPAFFLLGLVRQAGGRLAEAETCFRKTIYLDPGHDEALLALALIAQRRGESDAAAAYRRRAERARVRKGIS